MSQERARHDSEASEANQCFVKLRNLSKTTTEDDIREFLHPCAIIAVHLFAHDGEASNECVVELETGADVEDAKEKSNQEIDHQPIEVFAASVHEYNFHVKNQGTIVWNEPVLRMTGLPGGCTMADVQHFFDDIEIATNGIYITRDMTDTALGAGFVAFISMDNAYRAIDLYHQKYMGDRMIELSPSSYEEAKRIILDDARANAKQFSGEKEEMEQDNGQPESVEETKKSNNQHRSHSQSRSRSRSRTRENKRRYSRSPSRSPRSRQPPKRSNYRRRSRSRSPVRRSSPGSSRKEEFQVKMRGMPYTVSEEDIRKFFPSSCQPVRIEILQDRRMHRPNGDAYVYFSTFDEATEAMKCDRKYMGSRYIELYFDSPKYSALNHRRRRSYGSPRRVSPSPVKSRSNHYRRSRSDSDD